MDESTKQGLLERLKAHIALVQETANGQITHLKGLFERSAENLRGLGRADQLVYQVLRSYNERRLDELEALKPAPYFSRCDFVPQGETQSKTLYFGKFSLPELGISSWVSPVSSLRFEDPGVTSYTKGRGALQSGELIRKDQYRIVNGNIQFFSLETESNGKELVYQEHFSNRKVGFVLPEIVAQMEKAQDQVIRAAVEGPFVLSGPAGSGKTTLALHRVAYLLQSPETSDLYPPHQVMVFVQDTGTKKYFSKLLPELGITEVRITTFFEWGMEILGLKDIEPTTRFGGSETEQDLYEYAKNQALLHIEEVSSQKQTVFSLLEAVYEPYFSDSEKRLFREQKKARVIDRFDLTILLFFERQKRGHLSRYQEYYIERKNGTYQKRKGQVKVEYALAIVDEFQNSLPMQLDLIRSTLIGRQPSIVYVGDLAQQVQIGTIQSWDQMGEEIAPDRHVVLQKVYRNTKHILEYIRSLGYSVSIPEGLREGTPVEEKFFRDKKDEMAEVEKIAARTDRGSLGILAKDAAYLEEYRDRFGAAKDVYILSMAEAQGVEFDVVCIVGMDENTFSVDYKNMPDLQAQKEKIFQDLFYVALTRAMSELYVCRMFVGSSLV